MKARGTLVVLLLASLTLTGASSVPAAVDTSTLSFGNQKVGTTSAAQSFTITNDTGADVNVNGVAVTAPSEYSLGGDCGGTLTAGAQCTVTVTFHPTSAGLKSDAVAFNFDSTPQNPVTLSGTGTLPGVAFPNGASVTFAATAGGTDSKAIVIQNSGDAVLQFSSAPALTNTSDPQFSKGSDTCGATLAPGATCSVTVAFHPLTSGGYSGVLRFTDDAAGSPHDVTLTGSVLIPGIDSNPTNVDFGNVTHGQRSPARTVTITNTGSGALHIGTVQIAGANAKSFFLGNTNCPGASVPAGGHCTVNVRFVPKRAEPRGADLVIQNDAGADKHVALAGTGVPPKGVTGFKTATGCSDVALNWTRPTDAHLRGIVVVRNKLRTPRSPRDGAAVKHTATGAVDTSPKNFSTYHYAVFAAYNTWDNSGIVYSRGQAARIRTGRVCRPRNGAEIRDLTPNIDWVPWKGAFRYAFILQNKGRTILLRYPQRSDYQIKASWRYKGKLRRLRHGASYSFFVYAYTPQRRGGFVIGQTNWKVR